MLKYCFSNGCPCDEEESYIQAAIGGNLDCVRFLFAKVEPSRETEKEVALQAVGLGHLDIVKYIVQDMKISEVIKIACAVTAAMYGRLDCLRYLVEEAKVPLNNWVYVAYARYKEHTECESYLLEKGCSEPTEEEYALCVEEVQREERETSS